MALEPGTVYEARRAGDPVGLFTVEEAKAMNGIWFGEGRWESFSKNQPAATKSSNVPKAATEDDGRPILRRGAQRSPNQTESPPPPSPATEAPEDPDRPVLRRGRPSPKIRKPPAPAPPIAKPIPSTSQPKAVEQETLAAISDADGPEPHSYTWQWKPEEQRRLTKVMQAMAAAELRKYAVARAPNVPRLPATAMFEDLRVRAFDLDYDNEPELVFSARMPVRTNPPSSAASRSPKTPATALEIYVTLVARVDMYGQPRKLFSSITDSIHLGSLPRLDLVDAVDAEGDGRGEFLFRGIGASGSSYVLYRVGRDQLWKLFQSTTSSFRDNED